MGQIVVNGINLYYEVEGKGTPLVLVSGYTTDNSTWFSTKDLLKEHFQLFMLDNRGAGRSDAPNSPYTVETMAEDVRAFIEALKIKKPHLCGHSMGGSIAQTVAYKYPQLIHKLILSNSLIKLREASAFALKYFLKMLEKGIPPLTVFEGSMPWLFSNNFFKHQEQISEILKLFANYPYPQSLIGQKRQLEALLQFNSENWYQKITSPTLVIEGGEDILCPEDSKKLAKGIHGAERIHFPNQAHLPQIEIPLEFAKAILSFLS